MLFPSLRKYWCASRNWLYLDGKQITIYNKVKLYKYQAITDYSIDALAKREWWFSSPSSFNDPFEFKLLIPDADYIKKVNGIDKIKRGLAECLIKEKAIYIGKKYRTREEKISAVVAHLNEFSNDEELVRMTVERYQKDLYGLGVVSFTENNGDILMWSHYAKFHRGICFEFEIDGLNKHFFIKVIYSDDYPELDFENFPDIEKMFTTQLVTKSNHWNYEREWRCVRNQNGLFPYFGRLSGIIFGARVAKADKEKIKAVVRGEKINFYQASLHPYQYKLIIGSDK
jgi:hypothetical protein